MVDLDSENIPRHVAVIMDGNGRWAQERGKDRVYGHINGVESMRKVIRAAVDCGVEYLTVYAFSTENWGRPEQEVTALMELLCKTIANETEELKQNGVRMRFIGDIQALSKDVRTAIAKSEKDTFQNRKLTLIIAVNYSSRWEITQMVRKVAVQVRDEGLQIHDITAETIAANLATAGIPDPDLLIRTSGELRLSNFLLWQLSYSELYFTDIYWPDFDEEAFYQAIRDYQRRDRRYGLLMKK
ncbi:MAG TPA: isoprenyl transferase [Candidatus Alistipes merdigallinarum]|nr:isoprenyl transferase [Candidatus Alistipes merdigallinarum]